MLILVPEQLNRYYLERVRKGQNGNWDLPFFNWEIGIGFLGTGKPEGGNGK